MTLFRHDDDGSLSHMQHDNHDQPLTTFVNFRSELLSRMVEGMNDGNSMPHYRRHDVRTGLARLSIPLFCGTAPCPLRSRALAPHRDRSLGSRPPPSRSLTHAGATAQCRRQPHVVCLPLTGPGISPPRRLRDSPPVTNARRYSSPVLQSRPTSAKRRFVHAG